MGRHSGFLHHTFSFLGTALLLPGICQGQGYFVSRFAGLGLPPTPMPATSLGLDQVSTATVDRVGNVFFSAYNSVFRVDAGSGELTRIGGSRTPGYFGDNGLATNARFNVPSGLAADSAGNVYVADELNSVIRRITPNGLIFTVAGNGIGGFSGDGGPATTASLNIAVHVAADGAGNLYIADTGNHRIRKVSPAGIITTIAGNGVAGFFGDNGQAVNAELSSPLGLTLDNQGNLYIADSQNHRVRKLAPNGVITTVAGTGAIGFTGDGGQATAAQLYQPEDVAVDNAGNLYIADTNNNRVRRVAPNGVISTIAGGGADFYADNIPALSAKIYPISVGVDAGGILYLAENDTRRVRKVGLDGTITTVAGANQFGFWGDGGPAVNAQSVAWAFTTNQTQITISGHVVPRLDGVVMTLNGSASASTTTDLNGAYSFTGLPVGGTYTVTPSYNGYVYNPLSRTLTAVTSDQTADFNAEFVVCQVNAEIPPTLRSEGIAEFSSVIVLACRAGTPTPSGSIVPVATFTITWNTQVTSHALADGSEVFLAIDEPSPAEAKLCVPGVPNPGAPAAADSCPTVGTAGDPLEFKSGNANIFRGTVSGNAVTFSGIPFDPAGLNATRYFRIGNLRLNTTLVTPGLNGTPGQAVGLVNVTATMPLLVHSPTQVVGFVQPGLTAGLRTADNSAPLSSTPVFQQCTPTAATRFATLSYAEAFATAFQRRTFSNVPAGVAAQDTLGIVYNTESGYYNPNLPGAMALAGLADSGTRIKAVFHDIPQGVTLYTATSYPETAPGNLFAASYAVLTSTESGPYSPVTPTQTLDGRSVAALPVSNGSAVAVWEVVGANSLVSESLSFPLWISYSNPGTGTATVNASYAPVGGSTAPRFLDNSTAAPVFQIASCNPTVPVTLTTNPAGRTIQIDGSGFTAPQTVQWAPGTTHTIGVASPQNGGAGTRYAFANWSDSGAMTHTVTAPGAAATYTAAFNSEFLLTTSVSPAGSGNISSSPTSADGYYVSGTTVQLTAAGTNGSVFGNWSADLSGTANPISMAMNGPRSAIANFNVAGPAVLTAPVPGSTLPGFSATFSWTTANGATAYWLDVGTTAGVGNIFGGNVGTAASKLVMGLPLNGSTVYVSLYSFINGSWQANNYTFIAATAGDPKAAMLSPAPGSTLAGSSVTFAWSAGTGVSAYWLDVGTAAGQGNIFGGNVGTATSKLVTGLPTSGSTIYVTLYSNINSSWFSNSYTYTAAVNAKAAMSSPAPGSVLPGFSATFTWTTGSGVSAYWLDVGTQPGVGNLFGGNLGLATSKSVTGLPLNGSTVYVSLYSNINGSWQGNNYTYTAATTADPKAAMLSPAPGSTLSSSATFTWTTGAGVSAYWLDVGTAPGVGNLFGGNVGTATSKLVAGLPMNGGTVYVSLYSSIGGTWFVNAYTYTAGQDARAALLTPAAGSTLSGFSVNFTWTTGAGATAYWLDVGTSPGVGNIFGGNVGLATAQQVTGLPMNGSAVYASLYSFLNGTWQVNSYTFTAATGQDPKAAITSPTPGSTLPGPSATFTWTAGSGATAYWLDVGTAPAQGNIFGGNVGAVTSRQVSGLPMNGSTVYVSLYSSINGTWFRNAYTYTAASGAAVITSPAPGTTLGGFSATFTWSTAAGATAYWLDVGTAPAQGNIFGGNVGTATSHLVTGLPLNGSTVYVTLYSFIGGAWQGNAYTYTAATGQDPKAAMLIPAPGSTLSGGSATFTWSTGTGVSAYWLDVGTSPGVGNLFGGNVGTVTSKPVSGIPTNGSTIYVNLYSNIGGTWFRNSYTYVGGP